jgi:O-phosphoseryl-tRNA(Cys) synthetase
MRSERQPRNIEIAVYCIGSPIALTAHELPRVVYNTKMARALSAL